MISRSYSSPVFFSKFKRKNLAWAQDVDLIKLKEGFNQISSILQNFNLEPQISPIEYFTLTKGYKRKYYSTCVDKTTHIPYFFHAFIKTSEKEYSAFDDLPILKEITFASQLNQRCEFVEKYVPKYIKYSQNNSPLPWFVTEFIEGSTLENKNQIGKLALEPSPVMIHHISSVLNQLGNLLKTFKFESPIKHFDVRKEVGFLCSETIPRLRSNGYLPKEYETGIKQFLIKNTAVVEKEIRYFSHGDFHIGNIFYNVHDTRYSVKIVDWENYHINNPAYDLSVFFLRLFEEKTFRRAMIFQYLKQFNKDEIHIFTLLFRFNILYLTLKQASWNPLFELSKSKERKREHWLKKLLFTSLNGFEELIQI